MLEDQSTSTLHQELLFLQTYLTYQSRALQNITCKYSRTLTRVWIKLYHCLGVTFIIVARKSTALKRIVT